MTQNDGFKLHVSKWNLLCFSLLRNFNSPNLNRRSKLRFWKIWFAYFTASYFRLEFLV